MANPPLRFSFHIQARVLKRAIAGLSDPDLNPTGLGLMEVCEEGFELTAYQNTPDTFVGKVFGFLSLKATGLTEFVCNTHTEKMISLIGIHNTIERAADDTDIIHVYSVERTKYVCTKFRKQSGRRMEFILEFPFLDNDPEFRKLPIFSYGFEMPIPTNTLENTLNDYLQQPKQPPMAEIRIRTSVEMTIGGSKEVLLDETESVWIWFPYWESLRKTLSLSSTDDITLWIGSVVGDDVGRVPRNDVVVFRCDLGDLGVFMHLKYAPEYMRLPTIGTFWPLFAR